MESERIARMEGQVQNIDRDLRAHLTSCETCHKEIQTRFQTVERMIWTALGGLIVIGGMVGMYGHKILKVLAT